MQAPAAIDSCLHENLPVGPALFHIGGAVFGDISPRKKLRSFVNDTTYAVTPRTCFITCGDRSGTSHFLYIVFAPPGENDVQKKKKEHSAEG
jgi:hypothetical protein